MNQLEEYDRLKALVESGGAACDINDFLHFCYLHTELFKAPHEICVYKAMLVRVEIGEELQEQEKAWLEDKRAKYGQLSVSDLIDYTKSRGELRDAKDVKKHLEDVSNDLISGISSSTRKSPGLIEYIKAVRNNLTFSSNHTDLRLRYDADAMQELFHCLDNLKEDSNIWLTEEVCITLTQKAFIHILIGHIQKHSVPRKGMGAKFDEHHWIELYHLIAKVVYHLHNDLIMHFSSPECGTYDNRKVMFEGTIYGIHIDARGYIKTFYPVISPSKNPSS